MSLPTTTVLRLIACLSPALLLVASGCSSLGNFRLGAERIPQANPKNPVVQVLAMWQPGEGPGIDNKTTRGFVGTLYFFTAKSPIAAKTNGSICVYLFDDQGDEEEQVKPLHQFIWKTDDLAKLGQPGKLGESYTIFVPYTRGGFHKAQCSLRVEFTPDSGMQVNSEMAYVALPGRKTRDSAKGAKGLPGHSGPSLDSLETDEEPVPALRPFGDTSARRPANPGNSAMNAELARKLQSIDLSALQKRKESPAATPLNDRERARIIRDLQDRGEEFAQADEEPRSPTPRRRQVVLANYEDEDELDAESDEWEASQSPRPSERRYRRQSSRRQRPDNFDDERAVSAAFEEEADESWED